MHTCEDCQYVLIHYDKKGVRTVRCYYKYMKALDDKMFSSNPGKMTSFKPVDVTNDLGKCNHYIQDSHPIEHRTYRATKEKKDEAD